MSGQTSAKIEWPNELKDFEAILMEILEFHIQRFHAKQNRARAEVGPSVLGGSSFMKPGTGTDYWTMDYAKDNADYTLHFVNKAMLDYMADRGIEAPAMIAVVRPKLEQHFQGMMHQLGLGLVGYRHHEYGMQPAPSVPSAVERHIKQRVQEMLAAVSRGLVDPRLKPKDMRSTRNWLIAFLVAVFIGLMLML